MHALLQGLSIWLFLIQLACLFLGYTFKDRKDLLVVSVYLGPAVILTNLLSLFFTSAS